MVVTANKALLAEHGQSLFALAHKKGNVSHLRPVVQEGYDHLRTFVQAWQPIELQLCMAS